MKKSDHQVAQMEQGPKLIITLFYKYFTHCMKQQWAGCLTPRHFTIDNPNNSKPSERRHWSHMPCAQYYTGLMATSWSFHLRIFGRLQINLTITEFVFPKSFTGCESSFLKVSVYY